MLLNRNVKSRFTMLVLVLIAQGVLADGEPPVSSALTADHTGIVDQLILEEQATYARENAKPSAEPVQPAPTPVPTGPDPFVPPQAEPDPYFVGVFGADKTSYRVEILYLGSVTDYGVGDVLPGGYRLSSVTPQYVTVERNGKTSRLYLTSVSAVSEQATPQVGTSLRDSAMQLPPGLMR